MSLSLSSPFPFLTPTPAEAGAMLPAAGNPTGGAGLLDALHQNRDLQDQLQRYGFGQAGSHQGHPEPLNSHLEALYESYKHTNSHEWQASEQHRLEVLGQVAELQSRNGELLRQAQHAADVRAPRLQKAAAVVRDRSVRLAQVSEEVLEMPAPNYLLLGIVSAVLLLLTGALYLFYVCTSYRAMYPGTAAGTGAGPEALAAVLNSAAVFDSSVLGAAFSALYPALFPAIALALALVLHLLAEGVMGTFTAGQRRGVWGLLLGLTLALDALLAFRVHEQGNLAHALAGQAETPWYSAPDFWLVLACGLGSALLWGALLHGLLRLRATRDPQQVRLQQRRAYQLELTAAEAAHLALEQELESERQRLAAEQAENRLRIVRLEASLGQELTVVRFGGRLKLCLDAFHTGWVQFVVLRGEEPATCRSVYEAFKGRHFGAN